MKTMTALALVLSLQAFAPRAWADEPVAVRSLDLRLHAPAAPEVQLHVAVPREAGQRETIVVTAGAPEVTLANVALAIGVTLLAGFFVYVAFGPAL